MQICCPNDLHQQRQRRYQPESRSMMRRMTWNLRRRRMMICKKMERVRTRVRTMEWLILHGASSRVSSLNLVIPKKDALGKLLPRKEKTVLGWRVMVVKTSLKPSSAWSTTTKSKPLKRMSRSCRQLHRKQDQWKVCRRRLRERQQVPQQQNTDLTRGLRMTERLRSRQKLPVIWTTLGEVPRTMKHRMKYSHLSLPLSSSLMDLQERCSWLILRRSQNSDCRVKSVMIGASRSMKANTSWEAAQERKLIDQSKVSWLLEKSKTLRMQTAWK